MRYGRVPFAVMALCFLARAGSAQAGEMGAAPSASPTDGERAFAVTTQPFAGADDVAIALSQVGLGEHELLLTSSMVLSDNEGLGASDSTEPVARDMPSPAFGAAAISADAVAGKEAMLLGDEALFGGAESTSTDAGADGGAMLLGDEALFGGATPAGDAALASSSPAGDEALFASAAAEQLSDDELSEQRGGFSYQGMDIRLGAEVRSYLEGELVVQTNFSWTDAAVEIDRVFSTALTPGALAGLQAGMLAGGGLNLRIEDDSVLFGNAGQTAFIQRAEGSLQNIIINSASNVAIRQEIEAQLDIANFAPFQSGVLTDRIFSALSSMTAGSLVAGIAR